MADSERLTTADTRPPRLFDRQVIGPFNGRQLAIAAGAVALLAFGLLAVTTPLAHPADTALPQPGSNFYRVGDPEVGLQVGSLAPELEGVHDGQTVGLTDLSGNPIKLADLRGHPVWLNFWASWCPPCQEETPVLRDTYETYRDRGLAVVAVSVQETSVEDVKNYVDTYGLEYTVGFDATSAIFHTYHAFGLPTQVFIDGNGMIRKVIYGPVTREEAAGYVEGLLLGAP
jgi:thiol-disulfide isomerase/thioredoxin